MRLLQRCALGALSLISADALAAEVYGGVGTTGLEAGFSQPFSDRFGARLEGNRLGVTRDFTTSNVKYDAQVKFSNAGAYVDAFFGGGFRLTGGALIGSRKIHGTARSVGGAIELNGVIYPLGAGDRLDFDVTFPRVTPYLGIGWGHHQTSGGLHFYADAGAAIGRPKVKLAPSASLAARLNPSDLAAEQDAAQEEANSLRVYTVLKFGVRYVF